MTLRKRLLALSLSLVAVTASLAVASPALASGPFYFYSKGQQTFATTDTLDGAAIYFTVEKPYLAAADSHSLAEISVQSTTGGNILEVGWTVDRGLNGGSDQPFLFVSWWKNGVWKCYNTNCPGYADYAANPINAGSSLSGVPVGTSKKFIIQHSGTTWWLGYDTNWIGSIADSNFAPATFVKPGVVQGFAELAAASAKPCSDVGNGILGLNVNTGAARAGTFTLYNTTTAPSFSGPSTLPAGTPATVTTAEQASGSVRTFRYGGPMWNAAGTGPGTTGGC
jgi:Neprosin